MDFNDIAAIGNAMRTRKRPNTLRQYRSAWRRFVEWCEGRGYPSLPADGWTVSAYLAHRAATGVRTGTLEADLNAVRHFHRQNLHPSPTGDVVVRRTLAGLRAQCETPPKQARGLTAERFERVKATACLPRPWGRGMESQATARRRGVTEIALLSTMRDGLLRCGEAAALQWRDIHVGRDGTGTMVIRSSKTSREPALQPLRSTTVAALERIQPNDVKPTDSVFSMTPRVVNRTVARACRHAGLGEGFGGHSARVGMAQDLTAAGFDLASIMQAGRWRSPAMVARYSQKLAADRSAVAMLVED